PASFRCPAWPTALSRSPPALPSFPTRRSSDLVANLVRVEHARDGLRDPPEPDPALEEQLHRHLVRRIERGRGGPARRGRRAPEPDRKSTRLNSSHVEISYAVFCLKKKTREHAH